MTNKHSVNTISSTRSRNIYKSLWIHLLFLLMFVNLHSTYAISPTVDSLQTVLSNTSSDSERLRLMDELVDELINTDLKKALNLAQKALDLSQTINNKKAEAIAHNNMGIILYETDERFSALAHLEKSERMAEELGLLELQARNLMSIARYYRYTDVDSTKTVNYLLKSAEISKAANFHWGTGRSYAKLASFYTKYNQIDLCERYLELAAEHYVKYHEGAKTIAHYYNEVGDKIWHLNPRKSMDLFFKGKTYKKTPPLMVSLAKAYGYIGDNITAINYLKEAIPALQKEEKRRRMLGVAMAQLAEAHIELRDYEAASKICDEGIELLANIGRSDQQAFPAFYRLKGTIMEQKGDDKAALEYYTKSLEEAVRIKYGFERIKAALTLGRFYSSRDIEKGKFFCEEVIKDAKIKKHTNLEVDACDCLYKIYKAKSSYVEALNYHEQKIMLSDSLSAMKVKHALDVNSKIAEKDILIAEQSYQKELKEKELENQYTLNKTLAASMILGLLFILFLSMSYLRINSQNKVINEKTEELVKANLSLERSNEELERFAHIVSHDLKSPLRNILNFTGLLKSKLGQEKSSPVNDWLAFIENSGKRMNQLIDDVLDFSRLSGNTTVKQEVINLNKLVEEIFQLADNTSDSKNVSFEASELPNIKWHYSKIFLLFKNLIENGIKYNQSENPTIKIYSKSELGKNTIYIEDNGIGIEKEYFEKIFIMFSRLHTQNEYEGTGLGLATCKKIVDEFKGKIDITSEVNKGTIFKIDLPNHLIHQSVDIKKEQPLVLVES